MITFKLTSKNGSKNYYSFSTMGLSGSLIIDSVSFEIEFVELSGFLKDNEKEKDKFLYLAKKTLQDKHFPSYFVFATH